MEGGEGCSIVLWAKGWNRSFSAFEIVMAISTLLINVTLKVCTSTFFGKKDLL